MSPRCNMKDIDRKWPGKHMYCSKHNYGPMDSWYDCTECCNETGDEFEAHQGSDEYKEGLYMAYIRYVSWELHGRGGLYKLICPSRRKLLRYYKMSTILKKIPRNAAEEWIGWQKRNKLPHVC